VASLPQASEARCVAVEKSRLGSCTVSIHDGANSSI
jgi:hypothetical protein